jgi:hypothetical protein
MSYKEDNDFEHIPQASCPRREGWDGCEEPGSEIHTCVKGKVFRRSEIPSISDWFGWDYLFLGYGSLRPSRLRGFIRFSHWGLLMAYRDFKPDCVVLPFLLVVVTSLRVRVSVVGPGLGWGKTVRVSLTTRTSRTTFNKCLPRIRRLSFLPVHTAPVDGCVVSSTAAAFNLLATGFKWLQTTFTYDIIFARHLNFSTRFYKKIIIPRTKKDLIMD